jgi:uncharacterized membrane protein (UPF0136 family)
MAAASLLLHVNVNFWWEVFGSKNNLKCVPVVAHRNCYERATVDSPESARSSTRLCKLKIPQCPHIQIRSFYCGQVSHFVYGYAAIVAIVGTLGYVLKKSVPSIVAGLISAIILVIAGRAIQQGQSWGFPTALVVTVLLLLNFGSRYMRSEAQEFWPNGLMAVVSLLALVALFISGRGRA